MSKRILLILSHSIEEHDQLKLLAGLGYEVFSLGGYINPHAPHDPKRPALPDVPHYEHLHEAVDALGVEDNIGTAAAHIPPAILEWLGTDGVIIAHHYLSRIFGQWEHLREWRQAGGRVVWRTVGQSTEANEAEARPYRSDGLEVVRYSPKEVAIPGYVGADAMIRFYKDPDEWGYWNGRGGTTMAPHPFVTNVTQDMIRRSTWTNARFYLEATHGLDALPAGPGSEEMPGGQGELPLDGMRRLLQDARAYLYTGTQPASYTLGLLEALMTGTPVVSIGPAHMTMWPFGPDLFEGHELCVYHTDDAADARQTLEAFLNDHDLAARISQHQRWRTIQTFGREKVGQDWLNFLGA